MEPSPVMSKLYKLSIDNPDIPIPEILKMADITYSIYNKLCKNFDGIQQYRKMMLGRACKIPEDRKKIMLSNLAKGKLKKALIESSKEKNVMFAQEAVTSSSVSVQ